MVVSIPVQSQPSVILVVDPDPETQREIRDRLVVLGYSARSVDDYESAMGVITATPPDLVLVTEQASQGEGWNSLQIELNKWGIPVLNLEDVEDAVTTGPLDDAPAPVVSDKELKLRVDTALQSRTLQDALMT